MSNAYKDSGVSLENGYESVERIKKHVQRTKRLGVMGGIGGFGGMFDLSQLNYKEPVLVSGTDGVGTKLILAFMADKHDTVGQDLVAMCANDILAQGAEPLYFLDYIAVGKNNPEQIEQIVKGIADGCEKAGCSLIGGETAEMPDMYQEGHYDLGGFVVGCVEKSKMIDGSKIEPGQVIIGIPSSGIHSNGYSLVRKILFKDNSINLKDHIEELDQTLEEALLEPTKIYIKPVLEVTKQIDVKGIAHITGGGFDENIPRVLKENQGAIINKDSYPHLAIFEYLRKLSGINEREMYNIFNMSIGMVVIVDKEDADKTIEILESQGEKGYLIGEVTNQEGIVIK